MHRFPSQHLRLQKYRILPLSRVDVFLLDEIHSEFRMGTDFLEAPTGMDIRSQKRVHDGCSFSQMPTENLEISTRSAGTATEVHFDD